MGKKSRRHYDIVEFEDWMGSQVAELNVAQYGGTLEEKGEALARVTSGDFAGTRGVAVTALDGQRVVGVQTYRYWPYCHGSQTFYSLQSGGTLVHAEHRGQGLFTRMLKAGNAMMSTKGVDFLTGFPVPMSFGGFMKDGWIHLDSPRWFMRVMRPLGLARQRLTGSVDFVDQREQDCTWFDAPDLMRVGARRVAALSPEPAFFAYRYGNGRSRNYRIFHYQWGRHHAVIIARVESGKGFGEMLVGDILTTEGSVRLAHRGLRQFLRDVSYDDRIVACRILVGAGAVELYPLLLRHGFAPTPKRGLFITKAISQRCRHLATNRWRWSLMFADIDTW